jgi:RNA polymerase sigma factor (TIGR02999 family)
MACETAAGTAVLVAVSRLIALNNVKNPREICGRTSYNVRTAGEDVSDRRDITTLLHEWREGSSEAENELFAIVMPDLRRLAHYLMRGERKGHTLQPTELVDQIYFRLVSAKDRDWESRRHFFAIAGRAMRRHLIDHARRRCAPQVSIDDIEDLLPEDTGKLDLAISVDSLLDQLAATRPEWATLVEVKFFLGLTDEEAADALRIKLRTLQRMWLEARKWLFTQMESRSVSQTAAR